MPVRCFLSILFCWMLLSTASAQEATRRTSYPLLTNEVLFAVQLGIPSAPMREAVQNRMGDLGFGAGLSVLSNPFSWGRQKRNSPLRLGAELGYTYYGRFLSEVNINGYRGNYKTSYGILQLNAVARLRPAYTDFFTPFLEILAGGNFYLSRTHQDLSVIESALAITPVDIGNYASAGFNKGLAAGFSLGKPYSGKGRLTVRVSYNRGTDIRYVVRNSLQYDPDYNSLSYAVGRAPVRYVMVQLGIML